MKAYEAQRSVSLSPTRNPESMTLPLKCSSDPDWSAYPTSALCVTQNLCSFQASHAECNVPSIDRHVPCDCEADVNCYSLSNPDDEYLVAFFMED